MSNCLKYYMLVIWMLSSVLTAGAISSLFHLMSWCPEDDILGLCLKTSGCFNHLFFSKSPELCSLTSVLNKYNVAGWLETYWYWLRSALRLSWKISKEHFFPHLQYLEECKSCISQKYMSTSVQHLMLSKSYLICCASSVHCILSWHRTESVL